MSGGGHDVNHQAAGVLRRRWRVTAVLHAAGRRVQVPARLRLGRELLYGTYREPEKVSGEFASAVDKVVGQIFCSLNGRFIVYLSQYLLYC